MFVFLFGFWTSFILMIFMFGYCVLLEVFISIMFFLNSYFCMFMFCNIFLLCCLSTFISIQHCFISKSTCSFGSSKGSLYSWVIFFCVSSNLFYNYGYAFCSFSFFPSYFLVVFCCLLFFWNIYLLSFSSFF